MKPVGQTPRHFFPFHRGQAHLLPLFPRLQTRPTSLGGSPRPAHPCVSPTQPLGAAASRQTLHTEPQGATTCWPA